MRDRASQKVIEEDAGIGVPPGIHANPHAPIMDGGSDSGKSFQVFLHHFPPIIFLSKDEGQGEWGKRKERVKFTSQFMAKNDNLCHFLTKNDNLPNINGEYLIRAYF